MIRVVIKTPNGLRRIIGILDEDAGVIDTIHFSGEDHSLVKMEERYALFERPKKLPIVLAGGK